MAAAVLLVTHSVVTLALASALLGVFRALDSGPLQAWFIDASLVADPDADIEQSLANESVVICLSIGAGALLGGGLLSLGDVAGVDRLVTPLVLSLLVQVVGVVAIVCWMDEVRAGRGWAVARASITKVPEVVTQAVTVIRASRLLTALVVGELLWGFGMIAFETMLPLRLTEVSGSVDDAARVLGPTVAAAWVISAIGAAMAPRLVRRWGAGRAGAGLRLAHGITVAGMGLAGGVPGLLVAYLATYWVHSAMAPVHYGMVHRGVDAQHRATVVSANSLTSQVGGAVSGIALGALADGTSLTTAMLVAAAVLAIAAPLYLVRDGRATPRPVAAPAVVGA
jgi:predicted MFS family arabinose efflux permease